MDYQAFLTALAATETGNDPASNPQQQPFRTLCQQVRGTTSPALLHLLNTAIGYLEPQEIYCEVGCFQGRSLIGALHQHPNALAYAIDDFSEFDPFQDNFDILLENLTDRDLSDQVTFYYQDFEAFFVELRSQPSAPKIGLYFYDAAYDYRSVLMGLNLVKPFLADRALIVIAVADWEAVQQASQDFHLTTPECQLLDRIPTMGGDQAQAVPTHQPYRLYAWDRHQTHPLPPKLEGQTCPTLIQGIASLGQTAQQQVARELHAEALTYHHARALPAAIAKYREALYWAPENPNLWRDLGMAYYLDEDYESAIAMLNRALALAPEQSVLHYNCGLVLTAIGHTEQAMTAYQQAIALDQHNLLAYNNLGNLLMQAEQLDAAEAILRRVISIDSKFFGAYLNLGNLLTIKGDLEAAIKAYKTAIDLKYDQPDVHQNLALVYQAQNESLLAERYLGNASFYGKEYAKAITHYENFLEQGTTELALYLTLAQCYQKENRFEAAIQIYEVAVQHHPQSLDLYLHWIYALQDTGQVQAAIAVAQRGSEQLPLVLYLKAEALLMLPIIYTDVEELEQYRSQFAQGLRQLQDHINLATPESREGALTFPRLKSNFYVIYQNQNDRELQQQWAGLIHQILATHYPFWCQPRTMPPLEAGQKIRVGYISANISSGGVVNKLFLNWLRHHDRDRFEVYCFQIKPKPDFVTEAFRLYSDVFLQFPDDLNTIAQGVLAQNLHILVFVEVGMEQIMSQLSVLRLAPVQCVTWGHPLTTGSPTIDYFLSNELMERPDADQDYTEKLIRLPNLGIYCNEPNIDLQTLKTRQDYGLPADAIVYLCIQSLQKYLPQYDHVWVAIAQRVPQAKFVFVESHLSPQITQKLAERLQRAFAAQGLNADDYVVFLPRESSKSYFSFYRIADVFLDTFEFSGCLTTLDSLVCNLPVVTCPGKLMRGRQSYGILTRIGVTATIARDIDEYIDIAVRLGHDPAWRHEISASIQAGKQCLYEDGEPLRALESFYQQVVHEALAQLAALLTAETMTPVNRDRKLLLHVGCGAPNPNKLPEQFRSPAWQEIRLDIDPAVQPDLLGSITDLSAVATGSVDALYSSHSLEHIYHHEVPIALAEFYRVLKSGGQVVITLPNLQRVAEHVAQGNLEDPLYVSAVGPIAAIDILYGYGYDIARGNHYMAHKTGFTADTLTDKLRQAGFTNVTVTIEDLNLWATAYK